MYWPCHRRMSEKSCIHRHWTFVSKDFHGRSCQTIINLSYFRFGTLFKNTANGENVPDVPVVIKRRLGSEPSDIWCFLATTWSCLHVQLWFTHCIRVTTTFSLIKGGMLLLCYFSWKKILLWTETSGDPYLWWKYDVVKVATGWHVAMT